MPRPAPTAERPWVARVLIVSIAVGLVAAGCSTVPQTKEETGAAVGGGAVGAAGGAVGGAALGGLYGAAAGLSCGPLLGLCVPVMGAVGFVAGAVGGGVAGAVKGASRGVEKYRSETQSERGGLPGADQPVTGDSPLDLAAQAASIGRESTGRGAPSSAPASAAAAHAAVSPLSPGPQPVASLRNSGPAPTPPGNGNLPAVGTTWIYRLDDRVFGRNSAEVVIRVDSSTDSSISEFVTTDDGVSKRVISIGDSDLLKIPLGGGAFALELAPYLLAHSDEGAPLGSPSVTGYPHGPSRLSPWRIRVTKRGWEHVNVPAGSYRALRVQIDGKREREESPAIPTDYDFHWGQDGAFSIIAWYAPVVKRLVRLEHKTWEISSGRLNEHKVLELAAYRPPS
jgi:hypothetical protein